MFSKKRNPTAVSRPRISNQASRSLINDLEKKRRTFESQRSFEHDSLRRAFSVFNPSQDLTALTHGYVLASIKQRARKLARDPYIKRYLDSLEENVIGQGVLVNPNYRKHNFNNGEFLNQTVMQSFKLWGKIGSCEVTKRISWSGLQRHILRSTVVDGENFIRFVRDTNFKFGLSLQVIDPSLIPIDLNANLDNGNRLRMGIEFDEYSAAVSYFVEASEDTADEEFKGRYFKRVPANEMIHYYIPEEYHDFRGVSWLSDVEGSALMLSDMELAVLKASEVGASTAGFFTRNVDEESILRDENTDDDEDDESLPTRVEAGEFIALPPGRDFKSFDPQQPKDTFEPFVQSILKRICAGLRGASYYQISSDRKGASYSSLRHAALSEHDAYKVLQDHFIEGVARPVFEEFMRCANLKGALKLPGNSIENYFDVEFIPKRWGFIDPIKQVHADKISVDEGFKTRTDVLAERGETVDGYAAKREREMEVSSKFEKRQVRGKSEKFGASAKL